MRDFSDNPHVVCVLIVDDEPAIRESVAYALKRDGFDTLTAPDLLTAHQKWNQSDAIILDLMLPDGSGIDFLKTVRAQSDVAIVVLTSRDEETERIVGLELGADDYVVKPFSPRELVARVRAVLRRTHPASGKTKELPVEALIGPHELRLQVSTRRVFIQDKELELSKTEFDLLHVFLLSPGIVLNREQLLARVWGDAVNISDRTVDVHIKMLRKKIDEVGGNPKMIETVRGVGYRISS